MKKTIYMYGITLIISFFIGINSYAGNQSSNSEKRKKVFIIGIDGFVHQAITPEIAPNLNTLKYNSVTYTNILTDIPTWSMNGWSCILSGVSSKKHMLTINEQEPENSNISIYPGFFKYLKNEYPEIRTASIVSWGVINDKINLENQVNIWHKSTKQDGETYGKVMQELTSDECPDVTFVHFDAVDHAGHAVGYSTEAKVYADSVTYVDGYVGKFVTAIKNRPSYNNEDWLITVITDHGGTFSKKTGGTTSGEHGGNNYEERNIFIMLNNESLTPALHEETPDTVAVNPINTVNFKNNVYAQLPHIDASHLAADKSITIEMNIRASESESSDPCIFGNKDWNSGGNPGIAFANQNGGLKINIAGNGTRADIEREKSVNLSDFTWHFISVIIDRTNKKMKLYHNGTFLSEKDIPEAIKELSTSYEFFLAQDGTQNYNPYFKGNITEIRIFKTALSENTIAAYADKTLDNQHPNISDLLVYTPGTDGSGNKYAGALGSGDITLKTKNSATIEWKEVATDYTINYFNAPTPYDVAPTIFNFLNLPAKTDYNWDGKPIIEFNTPASNNHPNPDPDEKSALIDNFENGIMNYTFLSGIGRMGDDNLRIEVVENPAKDNVNSSNYVLKITRLQEGAPDWAGFFGSTKAYAFDRTAINLYKYGRYKILRTVDGATAKFKLENSSNGGNNVEIGPKQAPVKVNAWEELVFDFGTAGAKGPYKTITIMPDVANSRPAETVVYLDDISFSQDDVIDNPSEINENKIAEQPLNIFTNNGTVTISFYSEKNTSTTLYIHNMIGQLVTSKSLNVTAGYNEVSLPIHEKGIYIVKLPIGDKKYLSKFVL